MEDIRQGLVFPPVAVAVILIALGVSLLLVRLTPFRGPVRRGALALCSFGNAGYIPLSLVELFPVTLPMIADLHFEKGQRVRLFAMAGLVSGVRFLILPGAFLAAFFLVLRPLALPPVALWVVFLETHTPPATNLAIMASQAGINQDTTAFTILVTYVLFVLLLPVYLVVFLSLPGVITP